CGPGGVDRGLLVHRRSIMAATPAILPAGRATVALSVAVMPIAWQRAAPRGRPRAGGRADRPARWAAAGDLGGCDASCSEDLAARRSRQASADLVGCNRPAEEVPLGRIAAVFDQELQDGLVLDPLGDDFQAEVVREIDRRAHD